MTQKTKLSSAPHIININEFKQGAVFERQSYYSSSSSLFMCLGEPVQTTEHDHDLGPEVIEQGTNKTYFYNISILDLTTATIQNMVLEGDKGFAWGGWNKSDGDAKYVNLRRATLP